MTTILTIVGVLVGIVVVLLSLMVVAEFVTVKQRPARYLPEMRYKAALQTDEQLQWSEDYYAQALAKNPRDWIAPLKLRAIREEMQSRAGAK